MAKKPETAGAAPGSHETLRKTAESLFAHELAAIAKEDDRERPANWNMSPRAVVTYLLGGKTKSGVDISPKYIGNRRLIETAVATLATDRALLLLGVPGTAKSWVSEHLRPPSRATRSCWCSARLAPTRTRSATAGTMPCCWPRGHRAKPWWRHH